MLKVRKMGHLLALASVLGSGVLGAQEPVSEDPRRRALALVMEADDKAHQEIDTWIRERGEDAATGVESAGFNARIRARLEPVETLYRRHLERWDDDARGWNAFSSFLNEQGRREEAMAGWRRALELNPKDASIWNNLANARAEQGEPTVAFRYLEKARELEPEEPTYLQNLATMILVFEEESMEYFDASAEAVAQRAKTLYESALGRSPEDFHLVAAWANVFYRLEAPQALKAIGAWERAYALAPGELEKQGVLVHLARWRLASGEAGTASELLLGITDPFYATERAELLEKIKKASGGSTSKF